MKYLLMWMISIFLMTSISSLSADQSQVRHENFTYDEILGNRYSQPLPGDYGFSTTKKQTFSQIFDVSSDKHNPMLRFLLFREDSLSHNIYNYFTTSFTGDIVLMRLGGYAEMSVNMKSAVMYNEYLRVSIPFGRWKDMRTGKEVIK